MATTTSVFGWPIPQGSDGINKIADIVSSGLKAIENQSYIASNSKSVADDYSSYPLGASVMGLNSAGATNGGWPQASYGGTVLTMRRGASGDASAQMYLTNSTTGAFYIFARNGNTNGWSDWYVVTGPGTPQAMASGQVTFSPNGSVKSAVVMFPSGRFDSAPRVVTSSNQTTRPDVPQNCSNYNVTKTQMTIYAYRGDSVDMSVAWIAVEGVE